MGFKLGKTMKSIGHSVSKASHSITHLVTEPANKIEGAVSDVYKDAKSAGTGVYKDVKGAVGYTGKHLINDVDDISSALSNPMIYIAIGVVVVVVLMNKK